MMMFTERKKFEVVFAVSLLSTDKEEEEGSGREPERNARERGSRDVCGHRTVIPNRSLVGRVLPI